VERIVLMVVSVILALVVAAPMAFAQSQGGAPQPVDETPFVLPPKGDPDAIAAACQFPVRVEQSGKEKEIDVPDLPGQKRTISIFPVFPSL
jgi:hypothetical protein